MVRSEKKGDLAFVAFRYVMDKLQTEVYAVTSS
jgi:hypothetical protein